MKITKLELANIISEEIDNSINESPQARRARARRKRRRQLELLNNPERGKYGLGGDLDNAMPAACAVEMIHNYSLIHDDLPAMDDDELRRGRPTCHVKFGEATAILAGDSLIPMAFGVVARDIQPAEIALRCVERLALASGPTRLVGGQADDLNLQFAAPSVQSLEHSKALPTTEH